MRRAPFRCLLQREPPENGRASEENSVSGDLASEAFDLQETANVSVGLAKLRTDAEDFVAQPSRH